MKPSLPLLVVGLLIATNSFAAARDKRDKALVRQAVAMAKMPKRAETTVSRSHLNGKEVIEVAATLGDVTDANRTNRKLTVSVDGTRAEVETRTAAHGTYYRGFEGNHELLWHSFTVGNQSKLRGYGFRSGENVTLYERRAGGIRTERTARAVRDGGLTVLEKKMPLSR